MNESRDTNETAAGVPWIAATDGNGTLELSTEPLDFPINPWDIMLCMSGTVIACENAIVVAIIFYTPTLRTPMFVLIGSLATADLLAGMGLILNFVFQYLISSETISLITIALQQHFFSTSHYVATKKGVSTLAIILGTFGASWLPFAIYCLVGEHDYPSVYTYATLLPATYNSMINPIIYAYRNTEIQRSLYVLFCGCFQTNVSYRSRSPSEV
ncbi:hypothetical protein COCON_G00098600 [Conger conger]|uniref:G-protein coupled receptors family 1 profile domain-containing protein n=1 Tax=Conger conger TaxID=82655 RepID=A0A9Q1DMI5_CONCO|nr:hypothetical protein COCON_G00098600 [Conger conger]